MSPAPLQTRDRPNIDPVALRLRLVRPLVRFARWRNSRPGPISVAWRGDSVVNVERVSIENIFARLSQFEVTQGQYRWGEVQWQCLWHDIAKIAAAASRLERHFLGVMLLAPQAGS